MERRRSAPHGTGLVSAPAFAWGAGGSGCVRESMTPIAGTDEPEGMGP